MKRSVVSDANNQLAKVLTFKQTDEGLRGVLKTIDDVFAEHDLAILEPVAHLAEELSVAMEIVVEDNETLHFDALGKRGESLFLQRFFWASLPTSGKNQMTANAYRITTNGINKRLKF